MTYVVSNLYGRFDKFEKLLRKISFKDRDMMYILGNIVDFGEESIELVNDLSTRYNIYSILGEHDYRAYLLLSEFDRILKEGGAPSAEFTKEMIEWAQNGGQATLEAFQGADSDTREGFLEYLSELPVFEEVSVGNRNYILCCRGIDGFDPDEDLYDIELERFMSAHLDVNKTYFDDKTIVAGYIDYEHTPAGKQGKIINQNNNIVLCPDMSETDDVVCLCLETKDEYYV